LRARVQLAGAALAAIVAATSCVLPVRADTPAAQAAGHGREASLAEYRQHLVELNVIVEACAKARDTKTCDAALVGEDDRVPLANAPNAERRLVRYDWLRTLLAKAQLTDEDKAKVNDKGQAKKLIKIGIGQNGTPAEEPTLLPRPTTSELLQAAQVRLTQEIAQADVAASGPAAAAPDYTQEREMLRQVLAGRDFRNLQTRSASDAFWEKVNEWLNRLLKSAEKLHIHVRWLGPVIVAGFILIVSLGLAWGLLQMERRWRVRLVPESDGPADGAASARDWQLWLADARAAAAAGKWRDAIHFVYWATISRLESKRLWPADRARTPREYLALVADEDPRRAGLARLTGSFERVWYGGRAAEQNDYHIAEELADGLITGSGTAGTEPGEGGAR